LSFANHCWTVACLMKKDILSSLFGKVFFRYFGKSLLPLLCCALVDCFSLVSALRRAFSKCPRVHKLRCLTLTVRREAWWIEFRIYRPYSHRFFKSSYSLPLSSRPSRFFTLKSKENICRISAAIAGGWCYAVVYSFPSKQKSLQFRSCLVQAQIFFCVGILLIWSTKWSLFAKLFAQMSCKSRDESNDAN